MRWCRTATSSSSTSHNTARLLVCEMLHISANLASSPSNSAEPPLSLADSPKSQSLNRRRLGLVEEEYVNSSLRLICCEEIDDHKWNYVARKDALSGTLKKNSIHALIFWDTYSVLLVISLDFQREYLSAVIWLPRKWEKRKWQKFSLWVSEKRQERTRKWMNFKIEKLKIFFFLWE